MDGALCRRAGANEDRAIELAGRLKGGLNQAWTLCDIAILQYRAGDAEAARATFALGLDAARKLRTGWFRARALSKVAMTLVQLSMTPARAGRIGEDLKKGRGPCAECGR